ncbi:YqaE/Pmp3 family membrane protein [Rufibacter roseolus]|uniref:YqaE/Pmp3 family membrane protein n=1 Tax=Rufibacter roseolus TaxID=2817375 RepID=UPI001FED40B4|nr:YqaE/Pmp3 family membrane protein [Rufibacter roseolus]
MKFKILLQFVFVFLLGQFLFSCSSAEYYRFASVKPETYQKSVAKATPTEATAIEETAPATAQTITSTTEESNVAVEAEPVLEASTKALVPVLFETRKAAVEKSAVKATKPAVVMDEKAALETVKSKLSSMTKAEKKAFKKEVKNSLRDAKEASDIVEILLAIFIPPLGVFLHEGEVNSRFWISLLLTLLFFLPGVIYALLVVTDTI